MKALRKTSPGEATLELHDVPAPKPANGQVVIEVAAAGICGTDIHIMQGEYPSAPPVTLGHEIAGTIAELHEDASGWHEGQRVVTETYFSVCGTCRFCRGGRPNLCADRASIGSFRDGGFAAKVMVPQANLHLLPEHIGFPEAALMEPLACVARGLLELGRITAGDKVVIAGPLVLYRVRRGGDPRWRVSLPRR